MKKYLYMIGILSTVLFGGALLAESSINKSFKSDPWTFLLSKNRLITTLSLAFLPPLTNNIGYFDLVKGADGTSTGQNPIKERFDLKAGEVNDTKYIRSYYLPYSTNASTNIKIPVNPTEVKGSANYVFTGALTGCAVIIAKAKVNPNNLITVFHDGRKCKDEKYDPNKDTFYTNDYIILDYISFATYGVNNGTQSAEVFMYFDVKSSNKNSKWKMVYGIYDNESILNKGTIIDKEVKTIEYNK